MPTKQQQNRQMRNHGNRGTFSSEARRETGPSVGGNSWAATDRGPPEKGGKPFEKHARSRQGNSPRKIRSSVQKDDQENKPVLCTWYRKKKNKLRWHKREHKPFDWYSKSYNRLRRPSQDWTRIQLDCVPAVRGPLQSVDASFFFAVAWKWAGRPSRISPKAADRNALAASIWPAISLYPKGIAFFRQSKDCSGFEILCRQTCGIQRANRIWIDNHVSVVWLPFDKIRLFATEWH